MAVWGFREKELEKAGERRMARMLLRAIRTV
jgi:hypothetical protein